MSTTAGIPHVSDLATQKAAENRSEQLDRQPATPVPHSLAELHAYVTTDDVVKLRAWFENAYPMTGEGRDRYHPIPPDQRQALNLLESLHAQIHFPSQYAHDAKDIDRCVAQFRAEGTPLWAWCYLAAYYDYLQRQKRLGAATRADLRAVLNQIKQLDAYALREAQDGLQPLHRRRESNGRS